MVRSNEAWVALLGVLLGCSSAASEQGPAGAQCIEGQSIRCFCDNGRASAQRCLADGTFGLCACDPSTRAGAIRGDGMGAAAGSSADTAEAGSTAPAPSDNAGSAADASGSDGASGAAGADPTVAGAGDGDGAGGNAGQAGGDPAMGTTDPGPATSRDAYGPCTPDGQCADGMQCISTPQDQGQLGYCSPPCVQHNDGSSECPQPATGGVHATCFPGANLCVLGTCGEAECPHGMACVMRANQGASLSMCRYPSP